MPNAPALPAALSTATVCVHYPTNRGQIVLRTDADWERDLIPAGPSSGGCARFTIPNPAGFCYFKPLLRTDGKTLWAQGDNVLAVASRGRASHVWPYFDPDTSCSECTEHPLPPELAADGYRVRVFLPPGYHENPLARFPVLVMQDAQNLFFAHEAHGGQHWRVRETLTVLDQMSLIQRAVVVGVYPQDRMRDYTAPGYDAYGRFLAEKLVPWLDATYQTRSGPRHRIVMGSSLGGVVALHVAWQWPQVFGAAACLSSTFGYRDDLLARVQLGPKPPIRVYLDSGWPKDNYEATHAIKNALRRVGFRLGCDLFHLAFPHAAHDERHWADRVHVPLQLLLSAAESQPTRRGSQPMAGSAASRAS